MLSKHVINALLSLPSESKNKIIKAQDLLKGLPFMIGFAYDKSYAEIMSNPRKLLNTWKCEGIDTPALYISSTDTNQLLFVSVKKHNINDFTSMNTILKYRELCFFNPSQIKGKTYVPQYGANSCGIGLIEQHKNGLIWISDLEAGPQEWSDIGQSNTVPDQLINIPFSVTEDDEGKQLLFKHLEELGIRYVYDEELSNMFTNSTKGLMTLQQYRSLFKI